MLEISLKTEEDLRAEGFEFVIGIDEAGRGPLAGPVVAAAAVIRKGANILKDKSFTLIRDSKKLSEKQREEVFDFISENFHVGVGICDHKTIDRVNILEATYLAMKKALADLTAKINRPSSCIILVDGNRIIPGLSISQRSIIKGDSLVKTISAASIVAKVQRDRMMREAHEKYPEYGFLKHKGYGTKDHLAAIKKNGPSEIHRVSFEPLKSWTKDKKTATIKP
jgi:ribonuclease HII